MSKICALGYLGFASSRLDEWKRFAEQILGLQVIEVADGALDLRLDDYSWRLRIMHTDERDGLAFIGWEVATSDDLELLKIDLDGAKVDWEQGSEELKESRSVHDLISFRDPNGVLCEAFVGPLQRTDSPFVSPQNVDFVTGEQGLGHIVLNTKDLDLSKEFYTNVLGFKISDYINTEVVPGRPISISFLRCNGRHHSLALANLPGPSQVAHIMFQATDVDDVGRAMYRAEEADLHLSFTLGRHSNDNMLSFYVMSPSGFDVEYGWGGLVVDDGNWHVKTHSVNSAWGHRFQFPPKPGIKS